MRVLIISDMEGVGGIANPSQTNAGEPLYEEGRKLYTGEINAAVRGARAAGATEVCVMDHHGAGGGFSFNSLIAEELDPGCEFVVQEEWTEYSGFLEEGCDACLLVGMHAMAGTPDGVMNHTVSGQTWHNLWFNGTAVGETGINAAFVGAYGTPVALVTGDAAACREASALIGDGVATVSVKVGIGQRSARMLVPSRARRADRRGREAGAREPRRRRAVRPGQAVRDQGRVQEHDGSGQGGAQARGRATRPAHGRLARRRLADRVEAVLLLGSGGRCRVPRPA